MPTPHQPCAGHGITLALPEALVSAPDAAERWWGPIRDAWPVPEATPRAAVLSLTEARETVRELLGDAVVVVADDEHDPAGLFLLVDHLWEQAVPGVLLFPGLTPRRLRLGGRGVIPMDRATAPASVAATLHALAERQHLVDQLLRELRTAQRFQGGLRGEMDKLHEELQLAAAVQREFLPAELPVAESLDVRVFFRPAGYVSGDMYDVKQLDPDRIGFFVADAVGHGVPAALMTMVLSRSLSAALATPGERRLTPPGEVLRRINQEMIRRHGDVPRFATAVYGIIDTRDRSVTVAGAGHPPPMRCGPNGMRAVETDGCLLGVFENDEFSEVSFTLGDDELLIVFSDGFETAFPEMDADGRTRRLANKRYLGFFQDLAGAWADEGLEGAMSRFAGAVDLQSGSLHQVDDLTAVVLAPSRPAAAGRVSAERAAAA